MKKNTILDLNDILFAQLEKLSDDELKGKNLQEEILRSKAISEISKNVIMNANLALKVSQVRDISPDENIPRILLGNDPDRESNVKKSLGLNI